VCCGGSLLLDGSTVGSERPRRGSASRELPRQQTRSITRSMSGRERMRKGDSDQESEVSYLLSTREINEAGVADDGCGLVVVCAAGPKGSRSLANASRCSDGLVDLSL
jgi:hypothetical protein